MIISHKVIFLPLLFIVPSILLPVFAYGSENITAITNKDNYQLGDKVMINGSVSNIVNDNPVTIIVRNPMGNVYEIGQVNLLNNLFVHDFLINDNSIGGVYAVNIKYAAQVTQLHFTVNTSVLTTIPVMDSEIKVRTNGTNLVKYGTVSISPTTNTITISIDTSKFRTSSIDQQYQIPKKIVDSPGKEISLRMDGKEIMCTQSETDTMRILDCAVPAGSKEIELSGDVVIPEFGQMAGLAISISIIIMILLSKTSKFI